MLKAILLLGFSSWYCSLFSVMFLISSWSNQCLNPVLNKYKACDNTLSILISCWYWMFSTSKQRNRLLPVLSFKNCAVLTLPANDARLGMVSLLCPGFSHSNLCLCMISFKLPISERFRFSNSSRLINIHSESCTKVSLLFGFMVPENKYLLIF